MVKVLTQNKKDRNIMVLKQESVQETYPLHTHDFYEFFLVTKGRATHVVNKSVQIVERGSLVFVRPSDEHCYDFYKSQYFEFYNVGISVDMFKSLNGLFSGHAVELDRSKLPRHVKLNDNEIYILEGFLKELRKTKTDYEYDICFSKTACFVIYKMLTKPEFSENKIIPEWILNAIDEMSKKENFTVGLSRLVEICNYSQEHINREFKKYMKVTPTQYINKLRLRYSYELLKTTDLEIIDVSQSSGFNNLSHFYSEFKKTYGCSPNAIRKQINMNNYMLD